MDLNIVLGGSRQEPAGVFCPHGECHDHASELFQVFKELIEMGISSLDGKYIKASTPNLACLWSSSPDTLHFGGSTIGGGGRGGFKAAASLGTVDRANVRQDNSLNDLRACTFSAVPAFVSEDSEGRHLDFGDGAVVTPLLGCAAGGRRPADRRVLAADGRDRYLYRARSHPRAGRRRDRQARRLPQRRA